MEKNVQEAKEPSMGPAPAGETTPFGRAFEFEDNCRRLAKRYRDRLSIQYQGQDVPLCNWSATGCLVKIENPDPQELLTLLIPCEDGVIAIKAHFKIIRIEEDGAALRFIFDNAMDAAVLAAHANNADNDQPSRQ